MNDKIIDQLRLRTAELAVGPSTVRGAKTGTMRAAQNLLKAVSLHRLSNVTSDEFRRALDSETKRIQKGLPAGAQHWDLARKVLNIYLRSVVFNKHLCDRFDLSTIEPWLELPLDAHVANGILSTPEGQALPRWQTIKGLSPEVSAQYQQCARAVGQRIGVMPIHLEYLWWRV